jgi:beta-phosphoglucomutase-like phosphatase (HAD superfamily)
LNKKAMSIETTNHAENGGNNVGPQSQLAPDAAEHQQQTNLSERSFGLSRPLEIDSTVNTGAFTQISEGRWLVNSEPIRRVLTKPDEKFLVPNDTQAMLFDFDGTLLRLEYTESIRQGAFRHVLERLARKFNAPMTEHEIEALHREAFGRPEYEMSRVFADRLSDLSRAKICREKLHQFWAATCGEWLDTAAPEIHPASHIRNGIEAVMSEAKRRGIPMAVVTSGHSSLVEPMVHKAGLQGYVDLNASVFINQHHPDVGFKPAPDGYLLAFRKLGVTDPSKVIIFEDSATGALAGVRSGAHVLLQPSERYFHTAEELCRSYRHLNQGSVTGPIGRVTLLSENQDWHPVQFDFAQ